MESRGGEGVGGGDSGDSVSVSGSVLTSAPASAAGSAASISRDASSATMIEVAVHECNFGITRKCVVGTVGALASFVRDNFRVEPRYQILLCGHAPHARIQSKKKPLFLYFAEADAANVYLFNRKSLAARDAKSSSSSSSAPFKLQPQNVYVASDPSELALNKRSIPSGSSPLVAALVDFECQYIFHQRQGWSLFDGAKQRASSVHECAKQIRVLRRGIRVATGNMKSLFDTTMGRFREYQSELAEQQKAAAEMLESFDEDLARLSTLKLHSSLGKARASRSQASSEEDENAAASSLTLHDLLNMDTVHQSKNEFQKLRAVVSAKSEKIRKLHETIECEGGTAIEWLDTSGADKDLEKLDRIESAVSDLVGKQQICVNELDAHVESVTARVSEVMSTMSSSASSMGASAESAEDGAGGGRSRRGSSMALMAAIEELDETHEKQKEDIIPDMRSRDEMLKNFMAECAQVMSETRAAVQRKLLSLSSVQTRIRDLSQRVSVVKTAVGYERNMMANLGFVRSMPSSYVASMAEVVRRRAFSKFYATQVEQLAEQVAKLREGELEKRERFLNDHSRYLPEQLINTMGLADWKLPLCEIMLKPFDEGLPALTSSDVASARKMLKNSSMTVDGVFQAMDMSSGNSGEGSSSVSGSSSSRVGALLVEGHRSGGSRRVADAGVTDRERCLMLELENGALRAEIGVLVNATGEKNKAVVEAVRATPEAQSLELVTALNEKVEGYKNRIRELEAQLSNAALS